MHLVYVGRNILDIHIVSPVVSWALLLGAGYGFMCLVRDIGRRVIKPFGGLPPDPREPEWTRHLGPPK